MRSSCVVTVIKRHDGQIIRCTHLLSPYYEESCTFHSFSMSCDSDELEKLIVGLFLRVEEGQRPCAHAIRFREGLGREHVDSLHVVATRRTHGKNSQHVLSQ